MQIGLYNATSALDLICTFPQEQRRLRHPAVIPLRDRGGPRLGDVQADRKEGRRRRRRSLHSDGQE